MKYYSNSTYPVLRHGLFLPPLEFGHLRTLTDDTGILQHATYSIPNREHGYCVDDNARALVVACDAFRMGCGEELRDLASVYLSFIIHAFNRENGRFRNFMSYDRKWLEEAGSEDSHGRTIWGLGVAASWAPIGPQRDLSALLLERSLPAVTSFVSPRALAFTIMGLDRFLDHAPGSTMALAALAPIARRLDDAFAANSREGWPWLENEVTYANGILPLALLMAGERLNDEEMIERSLVALDWLVKLQTASAGHLSLIGNEGWYNCDGARAKFDQQPLDAAALVLACVRANEIAPDAGWDGRAHQALGWFLGRNDLGVAIYDTNTGGCRDGLSPHGANANQGAESTVEWLLARMAVQEMNGRPRPAPARVDTGSAASNGRGKSEAVR